MPAQDARIPVSCAVDASALCEFVPSSALPKRRDGNSWYDWDTGCDGLIIE